MADDVDTLTAVDVLIPEETYLEPSGDQLTTDLPRDQRRTSSYGIFDSLDGLFGAHVVPVKHTLRNKQAENIYDEISDEEELFVPPSKKDDSLLDGILGALDQIDWTKTNSVSINTKKKEKKQAPVAPITRDQLPGDRHSAPPLSNNEDIPVNRYKSVVAPVKSGANADRSGARPHSTHDIYGTRHSTSSQEEPEEDLQIYLGYLGSIKVPPQAESKGISAIQAPMRGLYFPYREKQSLAQERIVCVSAQGVEVYFLAHPDAEDPVTFTMPWEDILYVEPLRFSTKKVQKDKKLVRAAFEPSEAQRITMLGNRDSLYTPLGRQHKHISLLKHPALLCMVVKSPQNNNDIYTHGYVCSTVEESVFLAQRIRVELEGLYMQTLRSGKKAVPPGTMQMTTSSRLSVNTAGYKIEKSNNPIESNKAKKKLGKKKQKGAIYTTHTGEDAEDLGSFHFGMSLTTADPNAYYPTPGAPDSYYQDHASSGEDNPSYLNDNFMIGKPPLQTEHRQKSQSGLFSELEQSENFSNMETLRSNSGRPVGVVQPQVSNMKDAFRVLPAGSTIDKSKLKPTALHVKSKNFSDVTPELDLKLRMRQEEAEPTLSPLAPKFVVNPIADSSHEQSAPRKTFISQTPGPINKMSTSLPFNPNAALPQTGGGWNDAVIHNYKTKEKIDNKLSSAMVDKRELPKMKEDKKEMEMANLFSSVGFDSQNNVVDGGNDASAESGAMSGLHDALGFMP